MDKKEISGILVVDKTEGKTSSQIDRICKKLFNVKKIGHIGTLDPFATGVLAIAINSATKIIPYIQNKQKTYEFEIKFTEKTNTADKTGEIIETNNKIPSIDEIIKVLDLFKGEIYQTPHIFSSIKINGKRSYDLARKGITPNIKSRKVNIFDLKFIEKVSEKVFRFIATVSTGTYIRVLVEDIAKSLNTIGHAFSLRRTKDGLFSIDDAISLENLEILLNKTPQDLTKNNIDNTKCLNKPSQDFNKNTKNTSDIIKNNKDLHKNTESSLNNTEYLNNNNYLNKSSKNLPKNNIILMNNIEIFRNKAKAIIKNIKYLLKKNVKNIFKSSDGLIESCSDLIDNNKNIIDNNNGVQLKNNNNNNNHLSKPKKIINNIKHLLRKTISLIKSIQDIFKKSNISIDNNTGGQLKNNEHIIENSDILKNIANSEKKDKKTLDKLDDINYTKHSVLISPENVLDDIPVILISSQDAKDLTFGRKIKTDLSILDGLYLAKSDNGFLGIVILENKIIAPKRLINF